jgi:hypothetical protein
VAKDGEQSIGPDKPDRKGETAKVAPLMRVDHIQSRILLIRGQKVILDSDLAELYGVLTSRLNEQVKRNLARFPADFMFQLTPEEFKGLISQFAISNAGRGGRRKLPYAFTEHGAIMAAGVLNSERAVQTSIFVVRAFVRLRRLLESDQELATRLDHVERALGDHDRQIAAIVDTIELLMPPPPEEEPPREPFGFRHVKKN